MSRWLEDDGFEISHHDARSRRDVEKTESSKKQESEGKYPSRDGDTTDDWLEDDGFEISLSASNIRSIAKEK